MRCRAGYTLSLLCKGDIDSLKLACDVAKCNGVSQAMAQISAQESAANRSGDTSAKRTGAAHGLESSQKLPLTLEELCQRSDAISAEAKQLFSKWNQQRGDVAKKKAELDEVLDAMQGVQQSAPSNHLQLYSDLLLQVTHEYQYSYAGTFGGNHQSHACTAEMSIDFHSFGTL